MEIGLEVIKQLGTPGIFIAFLIWEMKNCAADRQKFIEFIERQATEATRRA